MKKILLTIGMVLVPTIGIAGSFDDAKVAYQQHKEQEYQETLIEKIFKIDKQVQLLKLYVRVENVL